MQQALGIGAEILDESLSGMTSAEPVIKLPEQLYCRTETLKVGQVDANPAGSLAFWPASRIDQPPQRGIIPGRRI
jgi:hypothetical protein